MTIVTTHPGGSTVLHAIRRTGLPARLLVIAIVGSVVACSGGGGGITTSGPWARTSPMVAGAGAAYVVITNTGSSADALVGAASDAAATVEIHETYELEPAMPMESAPAESGGMGGMESPAASEGGMGSGSGMVGMRRIERLEIPAGATVELKPGGYHLMLIDLARELVAGETVQVTLTFEQAGDITITAEVRAG